MNTNANNNIKEEPLFQPQYEYQGKENYSPTSGFLKKIYLVLDVQLAIVLALHLILGVLSIQTDNLFFDIFTIIVRSCFFIIVALILIFQMASARNLKTSPISTFILFTIRTLLLYSILRAYFFLSIKQVTLFISLILSLYLTFTAYMFCLGTTYRRKIAFIWLMSFIVTATGFLYLLKEVLIPGIFSHLAILLNVFLTFFVWTLFDLWDWVYSWWSNLSDQSPWIFVWSTHTAIWFDWNGILDCQKMQEKS